MDNSVEQDRIVVSPGGVEGELVVARVGDGRYRILDLFGLAMWFADDLPEEIEWGWILEAEELHDGRLQVSRIIPDETVEVISTALPWGFGGSRWFGELTDQIMSLGGYWELVAGGVFSACVPKASAEPQGFDLASRLDLALREWGDSASGESSVRICP